MSKSKQRLLIVEDEEVNAEIMGSRLRQRGFEVAIVNNGEACLEYLVDNEVDLILLDILMPGMSGLDVLKKIRETHQPIELPLSFSVNNADVKK